MGQAILGHIWKYIVEKSQTNATSVIMHPLGKVIWGHIRKYIVKKSQTNATSVIIIIKRDIWTHTVNKSKNKATNVTLIATDYASFWTTHLRTYLEIHSL